MKLINFIFFDFDTYLNLVYLADLMCVSKSECATFLINKTIENLTSELKND